MHTAQWLKITEKVSFNIASEASYVHILSGQKLMKNAKNGQLLQANYSVTRQVIFECVILSNFQTFFQTLLLFCPFSKLHLVN